MQEKDAVTKEYLSGFAKGETLPSVITIVVYWGQEPWDGPRRLKDMINVDDYPLELQQFIVDYPIHILDVRRFEHPEVFQSDMQYVFGFLQRDRDKKGLAEYVQENKEVFSDLPESTYNVISTMSKCGELKKVKKSVKKEEGEYDMCQAITEMIEDGRTEGRFEGKREERINMVFLALEKFGQVSKELQARIYQEKDMDVLYRWVRQALSAGSMEEFEQRMSA